MGAFALQPQVVEFLDIVMHDETLEVRMEQVEIAAGSPLADRSVREATFQEATGALLLAIRHGAGPFLPNPPFDARLEPGTILIVVGTGAQLQALRNHAGAP